MSNRCGLYGQIVYSRDTNSHQEPVLFNGTVFENILNGLVGTPWESSPIEKQQKQVRAAAKIAFAHEFIEALPQGYDTRIGERGGLLSGGQKQRIAIARSIISEPKILLLDEATSALDPSAESIVQKALDEASKSRTTIVIAHKLKTIRAADNIVVMRRGKIVQQGTHEELVAKGGTYASLVKAQDLSPQAPEKVADSSDNEIPVALEKSRSLAKSNTVDARISDIKDPEDLTDFHQTGVVHTIFKLVSVTPELWPWYAVALIGCIVGGKISLSINYSGDANAFTAGMYPGQTLLLANVMDLLKTPDMQTRGNFISLMFFVMALGLFCVFFLLGWATNVISQVSDLDQK